MSKMTAERTRLGVVLHGPDVYFGPENVSDRLRAFIHRRLAEHLSEAFEIASSDAMPGDNQRVDYSVLLDLKSPLVDCDAVLRSIEYLRSTGKSAVRPLGCIKGTAPIAVANENAPPANAYPYVVSSFMDEYRTSFDVGSQKRLKIFLSSMVREFFIVSSIQDIAEYLSSSEGVAAILGYGDDPTLRAVRACPHCSSTVLAARHPKIGWPRVGFLTRKSEYYTECRQCHLVFLNPAYDAEDSHKYYDDADSEVTQGSARLQTRSEPQLASYYENFQAVVDLIGEQLDTQRLAKARVLDLGSGDCTFGLMVKRAFSQASVSCVDFKAPVDVAELRATGLEVVTGNIMQQLSDLEPASVDVLTAFELIEHLQYPTLRRLLSEAFRILKPGGSLIVSTPDLYSEDSLITDFWVAYAPQHLFVYNRDVLGQLMQAAGFSVTKRLWRSYPFRNNLTEIEYYKDAYAGVCPDLEEKLFALGERNMRRLGSSAEDARTGLIGKNQGAEIIMAATRPAANF